MLIRLNQLNILLMLIYKFKLKLTNYKIKINKKFKIYKGNNYEKNLKSLSNLFHPINLGII